MGYQISTKQVIFLWILRESLNRYLIYDPVHVWRLVVPIVSYRISFLSEQFLYSCILRCSSTCVSHFAFSSVSSYCETSPPPYPSLRPLSSRFKFFPLVLNFFSLSAFRFSFLFADYPVLFPVGNPWGNCLPTTTLIQLICMMMRKWHKYLLSSAPTSPSIVYQQE